MRQYEMSGCECGGMAMCLTRLILLSLISVTKSVHVVVSSACASTGMYSVGTLCEADVGIDNNKQFVLARKLVSMADHSAFLKLLEYHRLGCFLGSFGMNMRVFRAATRIQSLRACSSPLLMQS
jgi:hypothetical protein